MDNEVYFGVVIEVSKMETEGAWKVVATLNEDSAEGSARVGYAQAVSALGPEDFLQACDEISDEYYAVALMAAAEFDDHSRFSYVSSMKLSERVRGLGLGYYLMKELLDFLHYWDTGAHVALALPGPIAPKGDRASAIESLEKHWRRFGFDPTSKSLEDLTLHAIKLELMQTRFRWLGKNNGWLDGHPELPAMRSHAPLDS